MLQGKLYTSDDEYYKTVQAMEDTIIHTNVLISMLAGKCNDKNIGRIADNLETLSDINKCLKEW